MVEEAIASTRLLAPWRVRWVPRVWVAVSGGLDSTVLLHAVRQLPNVCAVHLDHGLHPDSADWARHCAATASQFGVDFEQRRLTVARGGNLEANARHARYEAWRELLGEEDLLLLAHHADDQAETRLWQFLTGRHPGGMPGKRDLGRGRLVRPLLGVRQRDIRAYAAHFGLRWIEDPANADLRFDRNYIRHRLMPLVEGRFPTAMAHLAAARTSPVPGVPPLPAADATARSIKTWLLAAGLPAAQTAIDEICRQNRAAPDRRPRVVVVYDISAWRYRGEWHLVRPLPPAHHATAVVGSERNLDNGTLAWQRAAWVLLRGRTVQIRYRAGGERIHLADRGVTKTVKALHYEGRTPPWRRPRWPLLYDDASRLVAVAGMGVAAFGAVAGGLQPMWTPRADTLTTYPATPAEP